MEASSVLTKALHLVSAEIWWPSTPNGRRVIKVGSQRTSNSPSPFSSSSVYSESDALPLCQQHYITNPSFSSEIWNRSIERFNSTELRTSPSANRTNRWYFHNRCRKNRFETLLHLGLTGLHQERARRKSQWQREHSQPIMSPQTFTDRLIQNFLITFQSRSGHSNPEASSTTLLSSNSFFELFSMSFFSTDFPENSIVIHGSTDWLSGASSEWTVGNRQVNQ